MLCLLMLAAFKQRVSKIIVNLGVIRSEIQSKLVAVNGESKLLILFQAESEIMSCSYMIGVDLKCALIESLGCFKVL